MIGTCGMPVAATAGVAPGRGSTAAAAAGPAVRAGMPLNTGMPGPGGPAACAAAGSAPAAIAAMAAKTGAATCHRSLFAQFMMPLFPGVLERSETGKESAYPYVGRLLLSTFQRLGMLQNPPGSDGPADGPEPEVAGNVPAGSLTRHGGVVRHFSRRCSH